ncbi:MAG: hypothetical protein LBS76_03645 [Mycoplasmataceae bacterium]|nr:hypothetical protein [Mycoplasmataceae bacterium]
MFWHRSKLIKTEVHLSGNKILRKCTDEKFIEQIDQEMLKRGFKFVSYSKRYDWSWLTNEVSIIYEKIPS